MPVVYQYLTIEQQRSTAEQQVFAGEYGHFIASIELAANPGDPAIQQKVADAEALVTAAKAKLVALGVVLNPPQELPPPEPG